MRAFWFMAIFLAKINQKYEWRNLLDGKYSMYAHSVL
jgi:hypothetical protein